MFGNQQQMECHGSLQRQGYDPTTIIIMIMVRCRQRTPTKIWNRTDWKMSFTTNSHMSTSTENLLCQQFFWDRILHAVFVLRIPRHISLESQYYNLVGQMVIGYRFGQRRPVSLSTFDRRFDLLRVIMAFRLFFIATRHAQRYSFSKNTWWLK